MPSARQIRDLDGRKLIELDPIGTIADSFAQILDYLRENMNELQEAREELQNRQWSSLSHTRPSAANESRQVVESVHK